jgi:AcrR family transcriptional regulator
MATVTSTRNASSDRPADRAQAATGLRERKKARTRTTIQREALRLFREQGYHATTVEQVAAAAEVAATTVFRYFPAKEDLAVLDDYYSLADATAQALTAQPADLHPVAAIRAAVRAVFEGLTPDERAARHERDLLMVTVPELWAANLGMMLKGRQVLREVVSQRTGRGSDDPEVRVLVDAAVGVGLGVLFDSADAGAGGTAPADALDDALARLEAALTS